MLVSSVLSLFGSAFMLCSIFLYSRGKGLSQLIMFLAVGDYGWSLSVAIHIALLFFNLSTSLDWCVAFRVMFQFCAGTTVFWTACISFFLYFSVLSNDKNRKKSNTGDGKDNGAKANPYQDTASRTMSLVFHIICWGIPGISTGYIFFANEYVEDQDLHLCYPVAKWRWFMWFVPNIICFIASVVVYAGLLIKLRETMTWRFIFNSLKNQTLALPFRISLFLLVFIVCWVMDIVQFLTSVFFNRPKFTLLLAYSVLLNLQGLLDCLVYGITNKSLRKLYYGRPLFFVCILFLSPILVFPAFVHYLRKMFTETRGGEISKPLLDSNESQ